MMMLLTPAQSKAARKELEMDQATAAKAVGISRPVMSFFESEKMIASEEMQQRLFDFYASSGFEFSDDDIDLYAEGAERYTSEADLAPTQNPRVSRHVLAQKQGFYPRGGFAIPPAVPVKDADTRISEIGDIIREIREILAKPVENGSIFGFSLASDSRELHERLLLLTARLVCLSQELRGDPLPIPAITKVEATEAPEDHAGYLARILGSDFGFADDEPESSAEAAAA